MISEEQKRLMRHMLGLDNSKQPYRNYGFFYEKQTVLEDLVEKKLAIVREIEEGFVYHLTELGSFFAQTN